MVPGSTRGRRHGEQVPGLGGVDDVHLRKSERPKGYSAPIVDHSAERAEGLRRHQSIG
jgi:deoxyribodipyrimidine photo-lyase